jgi:hypothetical protein
MARCGCNSDSCACVVSGAGLATGSGTGTANNPYVISDNAKINNTFLLPPTTDPDPLANAIAARREQ